MASPCLRRLPSWVLLLALSSCTPRVPATIVIDDSPTPTTKREAREPSNADPLEFDLKQALDGVEHSLLAIDSLRSRPDQWPHDSDGMHSWLPDEGLRSLYYYAKLRGLSLTVLSGLFEAPVFVDGPHEDEPNFDAQSFGAYNPEFVERVVITARALARDPARVERTRPAFERRLQRQAITYLLVHEAMHRDPDWYERFKQDYAMSIAEPNATHTFYQELSPMCNAFSQHGMTWYETDTAAYFWIRRDLDGTAGLWREAVEALLSAYGVAVDSEPPGFPASSLAG